MFGIKHGFTIIELLIVIAIMGLMATIIVPNLGKKKAGKERLEFISRLNMLTQLAWQQALTQNKIFKVDFDFKKKIVSLEQGTAGKDEKGQQKFEPAKVTYLHTSIAWPENLHVKNFYIEGYDETTRRPSFTESWFFVVPDGLTQRVTVNVTDSNDRDEEGHPKKIGLVLNPFNAQFTSYDTFQK